MEGEGRVGLPARRLTDGEAASILRRASEEDARGLLPSSGDLTLADLMAAAQEAGLDPAAVRRAAAVVPPAGGGVAAAAFGAPDRRACSAVLEDVPLPEERHELVRVAREAWGGEGKVVESTPQGFLWQETHLGGRTTVQLRAAGPSTEIRVVADRAGHYLGYWFLGLLTWAVVSALAPVAPPPLVAVLGFLAAPPILVRPLWTRTDRRLRARLERNVMELARRVDESPPRARGPAEASDPGS